jgi:glycoside/pentoside/hexuronide:cation symporter, GPH family
MACWRKLKAETESGNDAMIAEPIVEDTVRAPIKIDISYALVSLASTAVWALMSGWLLYYYLPPDGAGSALVPAGLYSIVIFIIRTVNAVIAPPIGYISDRTQTRWGRRLPFMFASGLPMLVFFVLLWTPPVDSTSNWNLVYLAVIYLLYNFTYTLNQVPYTALLPEIARTEHHRVRVSAWSSGAFLVGMIVGSLGGPLIDRFGYTTTALIYAVAILPFFYAPFLVLRENPKRQDRAVERLDFRQGIKLMLENRAFQVMTATGVCSWLVTTFIQSVIPFIVTEICQLSTADTFLFYIPALLASLLCYPLVTWLSKKVGKWRVFAGSLLASAGVLPGLMVIGQWIPISLRVQGLTWITLQAIAMSGVTMLPPAFGAEITDYDEMLTGQRREGTYYASWGFLDQVIQGAAAALLPLLLLLGRSRSDPHGPLGVRIIGLLGGLIMLIGFFIFLQYPLKQGIPEWEGAYDV